GVALIFTLLLLTLLMALSLGMAISIGSQTFIAGYYRNFRGAFYAADSGANIARQALLNDIMAAVPTNITTGPLPIASSAAATVQSTVASAYNSWMSIDSGQAANSWPEQFKILNTATYPLTFSQSSCTVAYAYTGSGTAPSPAPTYTCTSLPTGNYAATSFT